MVRNFLFCFVLITLGCSRGEKTPRVHIDTTAMGKALTALASFPVDKDRCYGVSIDAADILQNSGGTCRPPLGQVKGFVAEGTDIELLVKLGKSRKVKVMVQLANTGETCSDIHTLNDYTNTYEIHSETIDLLAPETTLNITPIFPGVGNDLATTLNLPTTGCTTTAPSNLAAGPITPVYPTNGAKWNHYVSYPTKSLGPFAQTDAACPLASSGNHLCIHGGELRKSTLTGVTSCSGISAVDSLGAFKWACHLDPTNSQPTLYSLRLNKGKGLRDLLNASGWLPNKIMVSNSANGQTAETAMAAWWTNTISAAPDASGSPQTLALADTIYFFSSNASVTGYNVTASQVGLVTLSGYTITQTGAANCNATAQTFGAGTDKCAFFTSGSNNLWFEIDGTNTSTTGDYGLFLHNTKFSRIHNNNWRGFKNGLTFHSSNSNRVNHFHTQTGSLSGYDGIHLKSSSYNALQHIRSDHHDNGINLENSGFNSIVMANLSGAANQGIYVNGATSMENTFVSILSHHNSSTGIFIGAGRNTVIHTTLVANGDHGLSISGTSMVDAHSIISSGNGNSSSSGVRLTSTDQIKLSDVVATHNTAKGIDNASSTNTSIFGYLLVGNNTASNCYSNSYTNINVTDSTCAGLPSLVSGVSNLSTYAGKVLTNDTLNPSDTNGQMSISTSAEWLLFDNLQRGWGAEAVNEFTGAIRCQTGTCRIYDYTPKLTDTTILNRGFSGNSNNTAIVPGANCPTPMNGTSAYTDQHSTPNQFLLRGREIVGDYKGDDDGLCEDDEDCILTPNVGGYQGHGTLAPTGCNFVDGSVQGVKYFSFDQNGI